MPINKVQSLSKLIEASDKYANLTRKKVTFEYVLLKGINDSPKDAKRLHHMLGSINCKLNLIPYNEINGFYRRPSEEAINLFIKELENAPFLVTVRWSKGHDINAGCGQLVSISK